jgi:digeranylgeranylglycerophospholipid reductase
MTDADQNVFDVAVIGAGPMGSFAAERMARAGLRVGLFEKDASPGDSTVCAGGLHQQLVRYLNLPASLIEKTLPIFRVVIHGQASEWRFDHPTYLTVERRKLDRFMADRAVQAGATLVTQARVITVTPDEDTLVYEWGPERVHRRVTAKAFIFADGPNSLARRILTPPGTRPSGPVYVGLEYDLEAPSNEFQALEIIPDPEMLPFGYMWVFPKRHYVNVGLARLGTMEGPPLGGLLDRFVAERPDLRGRKVLTRKGGVIPATVGPVLQKNNCLVIGDAAGMINPLTGGGYVCGFVSATLAADACIEAFSGGRFDVKKLRCYSRRLRRTKHYLTIKVLGVILDWMATLQRVFKKPLYLPFLKLYFHAVHLSMRFVRVI